jgi:large repetitive protein
VRGTYEINNRWDVSAYGSALFGRGDVGRQHGLGVEAGYMVAANLWLSAGYNFFGYRDADLSGGDYTNRGAFVRMRFKFDEDLFAAKNAKVNNTLAKQ